MPILLQRDNISKNKNLLKKFSVNNNMDPKEMPDELQDFTEIKEILIATIFL